MGSAKLDRVLALERCRLYLSQLCAIIYCVEIAEQSSSASTEQMYNLINNIRSDLDILDIVDQLASEPAETNYHQG